MRLAELVTVSAQLAATPARNEKIACLADLLRRLLPVEIPIGVAYLSGHLRQGRVGLGWSALAAASDDGPEPPPAQASLFAAEAAPEGADPLTLEGVDEAFERIARVSGGGAQAARARLLRGVFSRATAEERDFLSRLVMGELRQGALGGIMAEAVSHASEIPIGEIRRAAMVSGDLEAVAVAGLTEGAAALARFGLKVFQPVLPMLAQPAADLAAALERLGTAALEHKLDGARIQAHRLGGEVRVYSRQLNDVSAAVPEVIEAVRALPLQEAILDGETIAVGEDGRPLPFQQTMRRFGRTLDVEAARRELPLQTRFFDLLRLDGEDWVHRPANERFAALQARAAALLVPRLVTANLETANAFYDEALRLGHEGLMAKALDAPYEAGGRGFAWLKVKPAHTLDLVVLAVERGSGRRQGWWSNIHLGARDPERGGFVMLGKTFKGMTDEILEWQTKTFPELATNTEGHVMYLKPEIVVEVAFNDVQESPRYPGGMALRLARVKRYRPDKGPAEADTVATVREILAGQREKRRTTAP
jgi:ATP-dependent DNA ligase I